MRRNAGLIVVYGLLAVAGAQFCYFSAVSYMQVGPALLIEYTLRPRWSSGCGCATASAPGPHARRRRRLRLGLMLVLDLFSGAD